ncbi:asparagine synthase, glutamine-hydrolyzing [Rivularia sp. PCC 7116]|uniref:lasso peptide isopeptide bond-forming cyclase n=1 Tax=Rivularia sp. PCC 7116 TaxID=373994 RepID=UPI00029F2537|nr:lasso peptide isopeptide bond-forming cyclase [Rivularia sp. PCC 7116]AFY53067.1 asparagine synthase, glutamine-hydrolyzing [Rivularia sp. PCC 7116]
MSGIVGVHYLDGRPVNGEDLSKMVDILAHRGPDGADTWIGQSVGLGHRMLWTTRESLIETLPLVKQDGNLVITSDARIDNREELIAALQINNRPSDKIGDSELILAAYGKWGEQCLEHLLGDFAFAIWDKGKQQLFCARDHIGIKPFYYCRNSDTFVFASEIKAIHTLPNIERKVNETRIAEYLLIVFEDKTTTFYQDIFRLPPGHCMTVSKEDIKIRCYWELNPQKELRLGSDEEYAEAFREIFTEAVRCRLRSAFPIGSTLSGGLDSSAITCLARNLLDKNQPLHTFSVIFDEMSQCDERPFINEVLAQGNFTPHYLNGDKLTPLEDINRMMWYHDEPFYFANSYLYWNTCPIAKNEGIRILLDGFDGDTSVSHGLGYFDELANQGRWFKLIKELKHREKYTEQSLWSSLSPYLWVHALKPSHRKFIYRVRRKLAKLNKFRKGKSNTQANTNQIINDKFVERITLKEHLQSLEEKRYKPQPRERDCHYQSLNWGLIPFFLEVIDKSAAAASIEANHPLFDKRLVEFCLSLPPEQKIHQGWTRMILRRGMENILPKKVQWRTDKNNFEPAVIHALLDLNRELVEKVILHNSEDVEDYVDMEAVRKIFQKLISERKPSDVIPVWVTTLLGYWRSK